MAALMSPDRYLAFETRNNASRNPGQALVTVSRINKTCFKARKKNLAYYNKMIKYDFFFSLSPGGSACPCCTGSVGAYSKYSLTRSVTKSGFSTVK